MAAVALRRLARALKAGWLWIFGDVRKELRDREDE